MKRKKAWMFWAQCSKLKRLVYGSVKIKKKKMFSHALWHQYYLLWFNFSFKTWYYRKSGRCIIFFFCYTWIVVTKLLHPELTKTNQIWAKDICISWGKGLDLEVILYEPVLSRRRCNVSTSSTFSCSPCERRLFSESVGGSEALSKNTLGWDLTRMESNPDPSTHARDRWEKFSPDTDTNIGTRPVLESG